MDLPELILAVITSSAATAGVTAWLNRRKTSAETDHTAVDTAADAIAMVRGAHGERIQELERKVKELVGQGESDRQSIINLMRQLGELRMAAETQSRSIMLLNEDVRVWRSRVTELSALLRERGIPLPAWALEGL